MAVYNKPSSIAPLARRAVQKAILRQSGACQSRPRDQCRERQVVREANIRQGPRTGRALQGEAGTKFQSPPPRTPGPRFGGAGGGGGPGGRPFNGPAPKKKRGGPFGRGGAGLGNPPFFFLRFRKAVF